MNTLLQLQDLDLKIEALRARETEIPKQKSKFDIHRKRLAAELGEREEVLKRLQLEQREAESDIDAKQTQIKKYDAQLMGVKKNEEYQALLHEIEMIKKQVALKEERIISIMVELDNAKASLVEDKQRIDAELKEIEGQCGEIDTELNEAVQERNQLEKQREPLLKEVDPALLSRYQRIRLAKKTGKAVVPLNGEVCSGCHMHVPPQIVNEVMAGKLHSCAHCGRLLYDREFFPQDGQ